MPPRLTPRESEVFQFLFKDLQIKEIAAAMSLDSRTVCSYAGRIYRKYGVETRIGLIVKVLGTANANAAEAAPNE